MESILNLNVFDLNQFLTFFYESNLKCDHPVLVQILELYTEMTREGREIVFIWVPGHVWH